MIFLYKLLELLVQLVIIFFIIAFERVIGLPILFLTISVSMLLVSKSIGRYAIFILASFMLAIFYQLAFILSFVLIAIFYFGFVFGSQFIESNLNRFLALLAIVNLVIYFFSISDFNFTVLAQILVESLISAVFLIKFLFVRYGFLGTKMNSRHSFFK